jgi:hypothetical protein
MVMKYFKYYLYALLIGALSVSFYSCNEEDDELTDETENSNSSKYDTPRGGNIVGEWYFNSKMSEITIGEEDLLPVLSTLIPDFDIQKAMNVLGEKVEFKEDGSLIIYGNEGNYSTNNGDLSISAMLENGNPLNLKKRADFAALLEESAPEIAEMIQKAQIKDFSYFADKDSLLLYMNAEVELLFAESTYFLPVNAVLFYGNVPQDNDSDKEDTVNPDPEEGDKEDPSQTPNEEEGENQPESADKDFMNISGVYEGLIAETEALDVTIEAKDNNMLKLALYDAKVEGISIGDLVFDNIPTTETSEGYTFALQNSEVSLMNGVLKAIVNVNGEITTSGSLKFVVEILSPAMELSYNGTKKK